MFGRGLRLTALSSLASASLYTVHSTPVHSEPVVQRATPAESVCSTSNDNTNFREVVKLLYSVVKKLNNDAKLGDHFFICKLILTGCPL